MRKCSFITKGEIYEKNSCIFTVPCHGIFAGRMQGQRAGTNGSANSAAHAQGKLRSRELSQSRQAEHRHALPQKVVTAGPNCTEVFCALGLADKVIGKCMENHSLGALPEYADAVESIPTLSIGYPTAQQIIDSGCDFLYANSWIFDDDLTVAQLEKAGITVYVSEAETIEAVWQEMRDLAKVFNVENIEEIVSEQSTRLEAVTDKLGEISEPKTVFVLDSFIGEKLYTAGSANIESAYITAAGGTNAFGEISKAWDVVEPSAVAVADPWCIIIHDYEGSSYDEKVAALKADPRFRARLR